MSAAIDDLKQSLAELVHGELELEFNQELEMFGVWLHYTDGSLDAELIGAGASESEAYADALNTARGWES